MEALACDLTAPVLADLTSMALPTPTQWTRRSHTDWHAYLADQRTTP
ncbi:hypothetical protein ACIGXI_36300 [Kitasatospora aureofaciens]